MRNLRILVAGCGHVGLVLVKELTKILPTAEITVVDSNLERVREEFRENELSLIQFNISEYDRLISILKSFDLVVGLAPGKLGYQTTKACIEARTDMVDLSYMPEDPLTLSEEASKAGVTIIPDCGLAPGLSNILIGRAKSLLEEVEEAIILVGGIPEKPVPPLGYKVTWCVEDLIEEYTRNVKIVRDGRLTAEKALNGLELVEFPDIGGLEAFYTDGVRTLHHTVKTVKNMWEKTLRYPGHAEKIKLLRDLGFLDEQKLEGKDVSPRELTIKLLEEKLSLPEVKDLVLMKIKVSGKEKNKLLTYSYTLLDRYDDKEKITAMARTTAYTASAVIQLLVKGRIKEKGIIPPEKLGMDEKLFNEIMAYLRKKRVSVTDFLSRC